MFSALFRDLRSLAISNIEFFQHGRGHSHAKFYKAFCLLHEHIDMGIQPSVEKITPRLQDYDLSRDVQANGFRSIINVIHKCCLHILQMSRYININKESVFFRSTHYSQELDSYVETLGQLRACLEHSCTLMDYCYNGSLFAEEEKIDDAVAEKLASQIEKLSQDCFYGRTLGFQFCNSMYRPLQTIAVAMASFGESYEEKSQVMQFANSVMRSGKYLMNPELRGKQVSTVTRVADVRFCKAFWSITESEVMQTFPSLVCPSVKVNEVITLDAKPFEMEIEGSTETVTITTPCAHTGHGNVKIRLLSSEQREGQPIKTTNSRSSGKPVQVLPMSPCLVVHCHGGGFVAQSSKSHEIYLRQWAKDLNAPIVSIDYSLSPEAPFPRAVEECFYAYAWAVQNCMSLGSTGEVICFAGDSAGGNLMISTALRAASFGIRVPDGIMAAYTPVLIHYTPSPSRMMSLMDPLLPVGILVRCMAAYAGVPNDFLDQKNKEAEDEFEVVSFSDCMPDCPSPDLVQSSGSSEYGTPVDGANFLKSPQTYNTTSPDSLDQYSITDQEIHGAASSGKVAEAGMPSASLEDQKLSDLKEEEVISLDDQMVYSVCNSLPSSDDEASMDMETMDSNSSSVMTESSNTGVLHGASQRNSSGCQSVDTKTSSPPKSKSVDTASISSREFLKLDLPKSESSEIKTIAKSPSAPNISITERLEQNKQFKPLYVKPKHQIQSPVHLFRSLPIVKNPYMSPMLAPDEMLSTLPPLYLVACNLDPLLDDSVMFAKKLRQLGNTVDLHVVDDLPHGFLNFCLVSPEAKRASDICVEKIRRVLQAAQT